MGQQQLLLLVLGIVIVGIAVLIGLRAFSENQIKSNADGLVNEGIRVANAIQTWALTPETLGGGGGHASALDKLTADAATLADAGLALGGSGCGDDAHGTIYGCFTLSNTKASECPDPLPPLDGGKSVYLNGSNEGYGNHVCILVSGTSDVHVGAAVRYGT